MATTTHSLTAEELWEMPDDGNRYELVRGELRTMSPPQFRQGEITTHFAGPLVAHVKANRLGRVSLGDPGFILARKPDIVRAPDVCFIPAEHWPAMERPAYWEGAPDLVVEVVSPSDTVYDVDEKVEDWISLGCRMVVVVNDRTRTVAVHRPGQPSCTLRGSEVFDGEDVVPGFRLPLPEIFA